MHSVLPTCDLRFISLTFHWPSRNLGYFARCDDIWRSKLRLSEVKSHGNVAHFLHRQIDVLKSCSFSLTALCCVTFSIVAWSQKRCRLLEWLVVVSLLPLRMERCYFVHIQKRSERLWQNPLSHQQAVLKNIQFFKKKFFGSVRKKLNKIMVLPFSVTKQFEYHNFNKTRSSPPSQMYWALETAPTCAVRFFRLVFIQVLRRQ